MSDEVTSIRNRILEIVHQQFGRAEEELVAGGILDSLSAVELALTLEQEFSLDADSFALSDMVTVTTLSERILAVMNGAGPAPLSHAAADHSA